MKRLIPIAAVAIAAVVAIIAAGGGSTKNGPSSAAASTKGGSPGTAAIRTTKGKLGTYLVDGRGRTLYLFEADKQNVSNCSSACLSIWPAFASNGKAPVASGGAVAGKLGVTAPGHGAAIATYNGHPLYYYVGDKQPGDTTGQGLDQFGGGWYVVTPGGDKIDNG